ncbi:hypothetical protein Ahy_A03g013193 isoform B [Arachis hypogaea]|uniref:UDP-N-acetylglucosamine transferase subunit ALG14 n=1 Tax=Arachis hypogaea TaxID=3818 RepID=A0A445DV55_ARAHY|nr:hypothetical protein Ahy_A03g013193 isoform B [Arachis hypogaea]
MGDGKVNLPDDLFSSKPSDSKDLFLRSYHWSHSQFHKPLWPSSLLKAKKHFLKQATLLNRVVLAFVGENRALQAKVSIPELYNGIGAHTIEMLNLLAVLQKDKFNPRFYVATATDNISLQKAQLLENSLVDQL